MAQLRARRGMSQQVFADRIRKSKSWVDKVERGVRTLDRLSVIETVAGALGVAPGVLLAGKVQRARAVDSGGAVEGVRAALARYDMPGSGNDRQSPPSVRQLDDQAGYAWTAYRNGHHPQVLRMLPDLLGDSRHTCHPQPGNASTAEVLVRVYRLAAQVLVKLGEADLAWLAADRAMTAALTAVHQLDLARPPDCPAGGPALTGTLLIEAALAAAASGDAAATADLIERAARLAATHDERHHRDHDGVGFGPTTVELARALTAMHFGDHQRAVTTHRRATSDDAWHLLPAEHRAAHLIDITRTHLDLGDPHAAGRALVTADAIAPAEIRLRPAAHTALTAVLRAGSPAADVTRLAATLGLTWLP
ncbi:helix-turn-helix domain-containing protein [Micromonospora sp. NPDC049060]|uniref:helix-turn-helix domain-containing protein n=1 Tax=Micromonospora sp. NPDC049060 TaxID=3154828 RepID=UPI00340E0A5E